MYGWMDGTQEPGREVSGTSSGDLSDEIALSITPAHCQSHGSHMSTGPVSRSFHASQNPGGSRGTSPRPGRTWALGQLFLFPGRYPYPFCIALQNLKNGNNDICLKQPLPHRAVSRSRWEEENVGRARSIIIIALCLRETERRGRPGREQRQKQKEVTVPAAQSFLPSDKGA